MLEDAPASNGPIHAAITKRYLQQRSVIFRSSGEILAAIGGSVGSMKKNNFLNKFKIGNRWVGEGEPCFIIAEAGSNHDRDLDQAKRLDFIKQWTTAMKAGK